MEPLRPWNQLLLLGICLFGCTVGEKIVVVDPVLAPVAAGYALYHELKDVELTVEFTINNSCVRITPLDNYRFQLISSGGKPGEALIDHVLTGKTMKLRQAHLRKGHYEAKIYHQDRPDRMSRKTFLISSPRPLIVMEVPCLDAKS